MKAHKWSDDDEQLLLRAIEECAPLFVHFPQQGRSYNESNAWDAVAGRLLPQVCVTGRAARRRYDAILERRREEAEQARVHVQEGAVDALKQWDDEWERVTAMVEQYEADIHERNADELVALHRKVEAIGTYLSRIGRELGLEDWEVWR